MMEKLSRVPLLDVVNREFNGKLSMLITCILRKNEWKIIWYMNRYISTWMLHQNLIYYSDYLKWYSKLAKITIPHIHLPPSNWWINWPINEVRVSNLNWLQISPCKYLPENLLQTITSQAWAVNIYQLKISM